MAATVNEIVNLLPHRAPFLFVDRIEQADENGGRGWKRFTEDEFFFPGHFPGYAVVPGVILVETMAQCGGAMIKQLRLNNGEKETDSLLFFLAQIEKARFKRQVRPGDNCLIEIENLRVSSASIKQKGRISVDSQLAAEAQWLCMGGPAPA